VAAAAAVAPLPSNAVERWYASGLYPRLQRLLTTLSNLAPFSLFDALCLAAVVAFALLLYRSIHTRGWARGLARTGREALVASAAIYLVFLLTWGLNYRRVPLSEKLAFDAARTSPEAVDQLALRTIDGLNRFYAGAHQTPVDLTALGQAFQSAQAALRGPRIVPGRPKETLLGGYFHNAAIAGMTDPFLLETLVAPDLLDVEKPFVIAHEWGHLAGYADEAEANFIAWLTCMRGDEGAQYSAWLGLLGHARSRDRRVFGRLTLGPRIDIFAMSARYDGTPRLLRFAAREGYDKYLKANRVAKGIESYDAVVQLIVGTTFDPAGNPVLRPRD
jgi:hypothetical protein